MRLFLTLCNAFWLSLWDFHLNINSSNSSNFVDIEECCVYFRDGQERFLSAMQQVHDVGNLEIPLIQPIQPNDSASQVSQSRKSDISKYSKSSSSSSVKSALEKRMLQNATRKATLVAEERMLARRQSLAYQEMKLSQLREEFHLQEELTKLDAEKEVFEEVLKSDVCLFVCPLILIQYFNSFYKKN